MGTSGLRIASSPEKKMGDFFRLLPPCGHELVGDSDHESASGNSPEPKEEEGGGGEEEGEEEPSLHIL